MTLTMPDPTRPTEGDTAADDDRRDTAPGDKPSPIVDVDEARAMLKGISRRTVERLAESGEIRKAKVRHRTFYSRASIESYLRRIAGRKPRDGNG